MKRIIHTQKEQSPSFSSPAWLLLGLIHSMPGQLKLQNEQLIYTVFNSGTLGPRGLAKLEKKLQMTDLAGKLAKNETTPLFKTAVSDIHSIRFPFYYFSAGTHLQVKEVQYRLSFIRPNNTRVHARTMAGIKEIPASVSIGRDWKKLLLPK
jgi:hypothetical protein